MIYAETGEQTPAAAANSMGVRSRAIFLLARLVPNLLGVATTAVLTRLLSPVEYGLYALGLSIVFFLSMCVFEWLGLSLLRMAPKSERPDVLFGVLMSFFCALCAVSVAGAVLGLLIADLGSYAFLTMASLVAAFSSAWFELRQRMHLAELRAADFFWSSAIRGAITIVMVCAATYFFRRAPEILLALAVGNVVAGLSRRESRLSIRRLRFNPAVVRVLLRFGVPLSVSVGLATLSSLVDKWLLQWMVGPEAVGLFTAATVVAQMPILALAGGIGPSAYSMAVQALEFRSPEAARAQLRQNFIILLGIIAPSAAGIVAVSSNLAHILVGENYWRSTVLLAPWLAAGGALMAMRAFYVDVAFQLGHRTSRLIWTMLVILVANFMLDLWLIPRWGELGAAIGGCSSLLIGLVVGAVASVSVFRLPLPLADTAKILASAGIMLVALHQVRDFSGMFALVGQVGGGFLIYAGGLIAFNVAGVRTWTMKRLGPFPFVRRQA